MLLLCKFVIVRERVFYWTEREEVWKESLVGAQNQAFDLNIYSYINQSQSCYFGEHRNLTEKLVATADNSSGEGTLS